jgi:CDP-paratose 2-epimerase
VTIYGDGKQVRDVLFIDDLVAAFDAAIAHIEIANGKAYNIGGGPRNTLSLLELIDLLEKDLGYRLKYSFDEWRPGDQLIFVSNIAKAKADLQWEPQVGPNEGLRRLAAWLQQNERVFTR